MPIQDDLQAFLAEWHDPSPFLEVQTSGSTGTPKRMRVRKDRMLNSARLTCDYLGLKKGDKALLCMPLRYIAGKMMVVRSLYAGLDLEVREPSGHPLADWGDTPLRFAAMIPLQVYNTLRVPEERKRLEQTDILIIGGGAIDAALEQEIRQMPNTVYSTYGMTETLSHVALRRLNGPEASPYYHPFSSVTLSLSPDNTLVIDAPLVCDERLGTNDVARLLPDGSFAIISVPDEKLGEAVTLLTEVTNATGSLLPTQPEACCQGNRKPAVKRTDSLLSRELMGCLPKYQRPRFVLKVEAIPKTGSGKIDRAACRELARNIITKTL